MNRITIYFYLALVITVSVVTLLVTGSPLLNMSLNKAQSFPLGTLITWAGMISLPLTVYWGLAALRKPSGRTNRWLSIVLKTCIALGLFWAPIAYLLAGNWSFSFAERETFQGGQEAMKWFWRLSYGIAIGTLVTLILFWLSLLFKKNQ